MCKDVSNGRKYISWTPYEFTEFTNLCSSSKIGIVLQNNGDILIFKSKRLVFVKRNGKWLFLDYYTIVHPESGSNSLLRWAETGVHEEHVITVSLKSRQIAQLQKTAFV